ncbi:MAG: NUDIX domain-containing protein [Actinomycetota bacterium]|nr:NUDIX domain-containing protein [Actinomycetota bacterium]
MSADVIRAAGGVIFRRRSGILETLIIHRPRYDDLSLPKGKAHDGESIEATALREIREETGVTGELGPELQSVSYTDPLGRPKMVRYWLVKADGVEDFRPDDEVDALAWVAVEEAPATLTNKRDREVLAEAARLTEPLYLVRHAKAGSRAEWRGDDRHRPPSVKGERQAKGLVAAFRGRPIDRILSSPVDRCVQTVEPLARDRGLPIETVPWLIEGADGPTLLETIRLLPGPAVVSLHGDAFPKIVLPLVEDGVPVEGPMVWKKGSTWVLDRDLGFPSRLRYEPPPRDRAG